MATRHELDMYVYKAPTCMLDLVLETLLEWVGEGPFQNKGLMIKHCGI